jgi:hypothetical protein
MEKAQRVELIRARFRAKVGKSAYVSSGRPLRAAPQPAKESKVTLDSFGLALSHRWGRTRWLEAPDPRPDPAALREPQRAGEAVLTRIARKLPRRLLRKALVCVSADLRTVKSADPVPNHSRGG